MGRGERVRERDLPRSGYSTQHLPSAEVKQAEIGTGTPSPEAGEGGKGADAPAAPYKHRLAHASGRHSRSERAFRCVGSRGAPERVLLPFARAKGSPRRIGVQIKTFCKALRRRQARWDEVIERVAARGCGRATRRRRRLSCTEKAHLAARFRSAVFYCALAGVLPSFSLWRILSSSSRRALRYS